ncbi:MAG: class I SAM-dependent methyltransferase [Anaerolineae bacterium]|nr:class I SAM-dependent methyltransferase [Anaerolineae bacterium]
MMVERMQYEVSAYSALADVYDRAGFSSSTEWNTSQYVAYAQSMDWAGRRIVELGCGTGISARWLAQQGYMVAGIDVSPHMLKQAQINIDQAGQSILIPPEFHPMDMRVLDSPMGPADMVLAISGVINALANLRELEHTFMRVSHAVEIDKLFVFDVRTIRGLASVHSNGDVIYYDNGEDLMVIVRNYFNFETLSSTRHYIIWRQENNLWLRRDEIHVERGFPIQAIIAMLQRAGFTVITTLNPNLEPFDPHADNSEWVVFFAQKIADPGS